MTQQRKWPFKRGASSLSRQISLVEDRLDIRKKRATVLALSLGSRVRAGGVPPGGLLLAGCVGYMAGEWMHRPGKPVPESAQPVSPPAQQAASAAKSKTALLVELALDLGVFWAKANGGYVGRNQSR